MTKIKITTMAVCSALAAATVLPAVASAQSSDSAYCAALVKKYETYLDMESRRGRQPQGLDAVAGVERCRTGDASGIPSIEKALKNARFDLPARN